MRKGSKGSTAAGDSDQRREPAFERHNSGEESLEAGVAAIFAAIQSDGFPEPPPEDDTAGDATLVLLAELNRIWSSPMASQPAE